LCILNWSLSVNLWIINHIKAFRYYYDKTKSRNSTCFSFSQEWLKEPGYFWQNEKRWYVLKLDLNGQMK
jgi:hypothetical protein